MKVKFIYWEASCNFAQELYNEKYPHYALLLATDGDVCIVFYFTDKKQMVLAGISKKETDFVELAEVEIPEEIHFRALAHINNINKLQEFSDEFLAYVEKYRGTIEQVDDALAEDNDANKSPVEKLLRQLSTSDVEQPFPRKPTG
jgi:hypothetical protein